MNSQPASPVARLVRSVFDRRNPLARRGDRFEGVVLVFAVAVSLLGVPVAATVGSELHESRSIDSRHQLSTRHQALAVLLVDAPPFTRTVDQAGGVRVSDVPASWELPDGSTRTGEVAANDGAKAGASVRIWVDDEGAVTKPPMTSVGAGLGAVVVALVSWTALVGALAALYSLVCWANRRASLRRWADEWAEVGPEWTRRIR
ncbi:hypothetical protein [Umezawaea sp.]|uniref:Rv1733c family protein n=1 Tax=Umezawaea sp. TaxID=1955258 RepID=UPI002ED03FBE